MDRVAVNRGRNIILWIVTAVFIVGVIFVVCVLNLVVGLLMGVAFIVANIVVICLRPKWMNIWREKPIRETTGTRLRMPPVFPTEIRLVSTNVKTPISHFIDKPDIMIGRSKECDFRISADISEKISRSHALIHYSPADRSYYVIAQETRNGTRLNNELLAPGREYLIRRDDMLELADVCFRVESAAYH